MLQLSFDFHLPSNCGKVRTKMEIHVGPATDLAATS